MLDQEAYTARFLYYLLTKCSKLENTLGNGYYSMEKAKSPRFPWD